MSPPAFDAAPLSGVRVVDLSRLLPGAFATQMLAELGAEVIKVEEPVVGDPMRHLPPLLDGRGIYDLLLNRGKKSVALDLKNSGDAAVLDRLVATADVFVESFRPRTARRLHVSAEQLRSKYPRLVHCSITGYGQTGPDAERPGHDLNYVAQSGLLAADRPDPTQLPKMFIADVGGGAMTSVIGILAALLGRGRHGVGASLDISMHEAMLYWVMLPAARDLVAGGNRAEGELPTFGAHASYNVYRSADGHLLALGALELKFWVKFCEAIGRPDLAERHATGTSDQKALIEEMRGVFATRTRDEWLRHLAPHDVCLTPVKSPQEALDDPHVVARGVVQQVSGMRVVRPPFLGQVPQLAPPPAVGQHTRDVIASLR